ncbi:MAG: gluconate 2-dehydrogenase subunit 3 family protein [Sphingomicrobium sp.]
MNIQRDSGWSRRDTLAGAGLLAVLLGVPIAAVHFDSTDDDIPTAAQGQLLTDVCDMVVPRTDTPGAADVGVPAFVVLALAHGLEGSRAPSASAAIPETASYLRPDGSFRHLAWLEAEADRECNGNFIGRSKAERLDALKKIDARGFAADGDHPWKLLKALILTGYYTSQSGGSQDLRYELVPGRWDPDLPLKPADRAFSSDWTAVDFG